MKHFIKTSRITQAFWWQLSYFYQILQFCIKLLHDRFLLMLRQSGILTLI